MQDSLGTRLVEAGMITPDQLRQALRIQKDSGCSLGQALMRLKLVPEVELVQATSRAFNIPAVDLSTYPIEDEAVLSIPGDLATKHCALPLARRGRKLVVALASPHNLVAMQDISFITGLEVEPVLASETSIRELIDRKYDVIHTDIDNTLDNVADDIDVDGVEQQADEPEAVDASAANEAPIVRLVNQIFLAAARRGASDIHLEPYEKRFRVRFRIDGQLMEVMSPPSRLRGAIVSRLKVMASLDIAERRVPQDGRIKIKVGKKSIDVRIATLPTVYGEKLVMRLLDRANLTVDLTRAGFQQSALDTFMHWIRQPYGMVLVTGPTGSGKTTTLYSALTLLNQPDVNIMTAEDPVEYNLDGINQVNINEEVGLTFAAALRSFLRQDPNIVMIGEIRDMETGSIATKAALTGHLLLSTLHTNDAPSTVTRLMDMGIEPFLVASSLNVIVAQRLVRRICQSCKEPVQLDPEMLRQLGGDPDGDRVAYRGKGCTTCNGSGYKGRVGLFEVLANSPALRELILERRSVSAIRKQAVDEGMITLRADGLLKLKAGLTTAEELLKETAASE